MSETEFKKVYVEGYAMYTCVRKPKKAYDPTKSPTYCLDLIVTDTEAEKLTAEGLKRARTKVDEDTFKSKEYPEHPGLKVFALNRRQFKADGTEKKPPVVVDSVGNPLPHNVLIGNGSKVVACIHPYSGTYKSKPYTGHELLGIQVLELVPYEVKDHDLGFRAQDGYKAGSSEDESPF